VAAADVVHPARAGRAPNHAGDGQPKHAPDEARRLIAKIEIVHTPKHGSWVTMAECEWSSLERQAIEGRASDAETLREQCDAWELTRNASEQRIDWQVTSGDARIKLRRLYSQIRER